MACLSLSCFFIITTISFVTAFTGTGYSQDVDQTTTEEEAQVPDALPSPELEMKDKRAQEGYLLNIRDLIKKSKEQINEVNDKIKEQAVRRRNMQREEKAREYYDQAMRYFEEGKFDKARELWEKAIELTEHPEMRGYIKESVRKTKQQMQALKKEDIRRLKRLEIERGYTVEEVESSYQTAVKLFKQKKYLEAKETFEHVDEMFPDHRATRSYLMVIDQEIQKEQQRLIEAKLREEAIERRKAKEQWRKELERKEREREGKLAQQAEQLYQEALREYGLRNLEKAKSLFQEVNWILPGYKSAKRYLLTIEQEEKRAGAVSRNKDQRSDEFRSREEELLKQLEEERSIRLREKDEREWIARLEDEVEFLYDSALTLYNAKKFDEARGKFNEIQQLYPDYKDVVKYLASIDIDIENEIKRKEQLSRQELEAELQKEKEMRMKEEEERLKMIAAEEKAWIDQMEKEAKKIYEGAVELFKKELFEKAREKFQEAEALYPNYQSTRSYLSKIETAIRNREEKILKEEKRLQEEQLKMQLKEKEKEQSEKIASMQMEEEARIKKLKAEADVIYETARMLYKKKLYPQVKSRLDELQQLYPNYKDTVSMLKKVSVLIKKEEERLEREKQRAFELKVKRERLVKQREEERLERLKELEEAQARAKVERECAIYYDSGVSLYEKNLFAQAKEKFLQVQKLQPSYRMTEKYIKHIDSEILNKALNDNEIHNIAENFKKEIKKEEKQLASRKKVVKKATKKERPDPKKDRKKEKPSLKIINSQGEETELLTVNERISANETILKAVAERDKEISERAESKYQQGIIAFKSGDFENARVNFIQVEALNPGYKDVEKYFEDIEKALSEKRQEVRVSEKKAKRSVPVKKDEIIEKFNREKNDLYVQAVRLYERKQWSQSQEKFNELERFSPGYKDTKQYLEKISLKLKEIKPDRKEEEKKPEKIKVQKPKKEKNKKEISPSVNGEPDKKVIEEGVKIQKENDKIISRLNSKTDAIKNNIDKFEKKQENIAKQRRQDIAELQTNYFKEEDETKKAKIQKQIEKIERQESARLSAYSKKMKKFQKDLINIARQQSKLQIAVANGANWPQRRDIQYALLKEKERHLRNLDGERYKEYKALLEEEERALRIVEKERLKGIQIRNAAERAKKSKVPTFKEVDERLSQQKEEELRNQEDLLKKAKLEEEKEREGLALLEKEQENQRERLAQLEQQIEDMRKAAESMALKVEEEKKAFEEKNKEREQALAKKMEESNAKVVKINSQINSVGVDKNEDDNYKHLKEMESAQLDKARKAAKDSLKQYIADESRQIRQQKQEIKRQNKQIARSLQAKEEKDRERWLRDVADIYQDAIHLYKQGKYVEAAAKFAAVERMHPGYRSAAAMEKYCRNMTVKERDRQERIRQKQEQEEGVLKERSVSEAKNEQIRIENDNRELAQVMLEKMRESNQEERKKNDYKMSRIGREQETERERIYSKMEEEKRRLEAKAKQEADKARRAEELKAVLQKKKEERAYCRQIDRQYREIRSLLSRGEVGSAQDKIVIVENMLTNPSAPENYRAKMIRGLERYKETIKSKLDAEKVRQEEEQKKKELAAQKEAEKRKIEEERLKKEKENELAKLRATIKKQEEDLARQKEIQEKKAKEEEEKLAAAKAAHAAEIAEQAVARVAAKTAIKTGKPEGEDISVKIQKQKEDIRKEREQIQKAYHENLEKMYSEAVRYFRSGLYRDAKILFNEVSSIESRYKSTDDYMEKIQQKLAEEEMKKAEPAKDQTKKVLEKAPQKDLQLKSDPKNRQQIIAEALNSIKLP